MPADAQNKLAWFLVRACERKESDTTSLRASDGMTWFSSFKIVLFAFILSRYLIVLASAITFAFTQHWPQPEANPQFLDLFTRDFLERIPTLVLQDDAGWYLQVAKNGYDVGTFDPTQFKNWAFFPLHPLMACGDRNGLYSVGLRSVAGQHFHFPGPDAFPSLDGIDLG